MTGEEAARIAAKLTRGQRSTIVSLGHEPDMLGCAEATAARLTKATGSRPALTLRSDDANGFRLFALNADGLAVKAALERTPA